MTWVGAVLTSATPTLSWQRNQDNPKILVLAVYIKTQVGSVFWSILTFWPLFFFFFQATVIKLAFSLISLSFFHPILNIITLIFPHWMAPIANLDNAFFIFQATFTFEIYLWYDGFKKCCLYVPIYFHNQMAVHYPSVSAKMLWRNLLYEISLFIFTIKATFTFIKCICREIFLISVDRRKAPVKNTSQLLMLLLSK